MKKSISTTLSQANIATVTGILAEIPEQLQRLISELSSEQSQQPLGSGERSFTEALAHLINCEARSSEAIYLALLVADPLLPDLHPERHWGKLLHHELFECSDLLAYFKFRRQLLLRVLHSYRGALDKRHP